MPLFSPTKNLDEKAYADLGAPIYGTGLKAGNRIQANNQRNSTLKLIDSKSPESLKTVKWYVDCGVDYFLINGNMAVHSTFKKKNVPHQFNVRSRAHNWTYWRTAMPDVLRFFRRYISQITYANHTENEKKLKSFKKIFLKPGETQEVRFDLDETSFQYYDEVQANGFEQR